MFEPALRLLRRAWPEAEIAVLVLARVADIAPVLGAADNVRWLLTDCDPYRQTPGDCRAELETLAGTVRAFAPDCVVAACTSQTWLEYAVAAFVPEARQVAMGTAPDDPAVRAALGAVRSMDWAALYPERVPVEPDAHEWEKTLGLVRALVGEAPEWWPVAQAPEAGRRAAAQVLVEAGLSEGNFVACAAAGMANVPIKTWPAEHFGEILAWLEGTRGVQALLIGHVCERHRLEAVRDAARGCGNPALWLGQDGEMPTAAALLAAARFYFGNDTGAMHLAAALGRPVAAVFGGGTWPRFRPMAARALSVVQPLACFGCAWECDFADAPCVRTISVASVRRALETFLADNASAQTVFEADDLEPGARALIEAAVPRLRFLRDDGKARLHQVEELSALLADSEADRAARLVNIEKLTALLHDKQAVIPADAGVPR